MEGGVQPSAIFVICSCYLLFHDNILLVYCAVVLRYTFCLLVAALRIADQKSSSTVHRYAIVPVVFFVCVGGKHSGDSQCLDCDNLQGCPHFCWLNVGGFCSIYQRLLILISLHSYSPQAHHLISLSLIFLLEKSNAWLSPPHCSFPFLPPGLCMSQNSLPHSHCQPLNSFAMSG